MGCFTHSLTADDIGKGLDCGGGSKAMYGLFELLRDEEAVTAVEYAIMLTFIIVVCIGLIAVIGQETNEMFDPDGSLSGALSSGG